MELHVCTLHVCTLSTHIFIASRFPIAALKLPTPTSLENPSLGGFSVDSEALAIDTDSALSFPAVRTGAHDQPAHQRENTKGQA